jgi:hypothetical protein
MLIRPEAPIVASGWERTLTRDSGAVLEATEDGEVVEVVHRPETNTWYMRTERSGGRRRVTRN